MPFKKIDIQIDKLTHCIEHAVTGLRLPTEIRVTTLQELQALKKADWLFDWAQEARAKAKSVYKLVICEKPAFIQGLICLQDKGDHIFIHLVENSRLNKGANKQYLGVAGNLIAYACKLSFERGYDGFVSFESKTKLISHYEKQFGASLLFGNFMVIKGEASLKLIRQYFP